MASKTVTVEVTVTVPDGAEDDLLDWARVTFLRPDFTLDDAYFGLVSEIIFLGERWADAEEELDQVSFSLSVEEVDER